MQSLLILGRQPDLGTAEIESLYGPDKITRLSNKALLVDVDPCLLAFKRLGGSLKFAKLLTTLNTVNWSDVEDFLVKTSPEHTLNMPKGKMTLGLSLYGFNLEVRQISKSGLKIKRSIQETGRSVRLVPNVTPDLNTAQVIHNKLTAERSWELLVIKTNNQIYIAQTIMVQDITAYARRDQARPYRDSKIGMLPPKLAQIIINLAVGNLREDDLESICEIDPNVAEIKKLNQTVLDPFVGTGVILQEAFLMGYNIAGSDLNPKMIEYTEGNLKWLEDQYRQPIDIDEISVGDAKNSQWPKFDFVATETNLGIPLKTLPDKAQFVNIINGVNNLVEAFLKNLATQTKTGFRLCIAVPAWQTSKDEFAQLPLIDHLEDIGYNSIDFKQLEAKQLIYYRPNQLVARQLLTLIRK